MFGRIAAVVLVAALAWAVVARSSSAAGAETAYTVRAGDTLWSIAVARYGGDPRGGVWRIEQRNGVRAGTIRIGQTLVLP
jgi:nucleoid-associated protein YgaU